MVLTHVTLRHFRNLGVQELAIPPEGVAIVGANAQGKSNFLEAVYYLETFRSFRGAPDEQLVSFGEEVFRVTGRQEGRSDSERVVAAAFQRKGRLKKVTLDGVQPERIGDGLGVLSAVIFSPLDVEIVSGGPSARRRFLDILLSLNVPGYLRALQRFRHSLAQRNATLRAEGSWSAVRAWERGLVEAGAELMLARASWVEERRDAFGGYYVRISDGESASLAYRPRVDIGSARELEEVADRFRSALAEVEESERRTRTTMVGPQRDDMVITLGGKKGAEVDLRDYGSGGERRTAALALRLVEAETIRAARGQNPLVLLDDVFAELDGSRSERILELLEQEAPGQVILTAPKASDVRLRGDSLPRWTIEGGRMVA